MSTVQRYMRRLRTSTIARQVFETFSTRVSMLLVGLVMSVIISRVLGPSGRGEFAFAAALVGLVSQLGNLGLHSSNTYYASKERRLVPALVANSLWASAIVGLVVAVVLLGLRLLAPGLFPMSDLMLAMVAVSVPLSIAFLLLQQLYLALGRVRIFNGVEVAQRLLAAAATVALILAGFAAPAPLFAIGIVAMAAVFAWMYRRFPADRLRRPDVSVFRSTLGFGFRAYVTALAGYLVLRIDVLLVGSIAGEEATGLYSVVVAMADLVLLLPTVIGTLLFPRLSAVTNPHERWHKARRAAWIATGAMFGIAVVSGLVAGPVIRLLYGADFEAAAPAFVVLLPGLVAMGINVILMNYLASTGMPLITVISPIVAGVINIVLNLVLVPRYGIEGASWASTVSYTSMLVFSLAYFASKKHRLMLERGA